MPKQERLGFARLFMVLSSISPLFIIWAIRGTSVIPDEYFISFCAFMVAIPNGFLALRLITARKLRETRELTIGRAEDHREHLLVYLFAMLLPFYAADISSWREFSAAIGALIFIVFLFWHLNLHYMNIVYALFGYRVFTVYPSEDGNPISGKSTFVLITRRTLLHPGEKISANRLSDTVYFDWGE